MACWLGLTTSDCTTAGKMTRTTISATTQPPMPYSGQRQRRRQKPLAMSSAPERPADDHHDAHAGQAGVDVGVAGAGDHAVAREQQVPGLEDVARAGQREDDAEQHREVGDRLAPRPDDEATVAWPGARAKGPPGPNGPRGADSGCSDAWAGRCWGWMSPPMAPWMMTATTRAAMSAPMTRP